MAHSLTVYVRDRNLDRLAPVEVFSSFRMVERYVDVGAWVLKAPFDTEAVDLLIREPEAGVTVVDDSGEVLFGGFAVHLDREVGDQDTVTVTGVDDNAWLTYRVSSPEPLNPNPDSWVTAYDVHTGVVTAAVRSFVNVQAGPGALAERAVPGLVIGNSPEEGPTVTITGRGMTLLEELAPVCQGAQAVAHVRQSGQRLVFDCRLARSLPSVVFSPDFGSVSGYRYSMEAPKVTTVYVAGQGEREERVIRKVDAVIDPNWGRRVEKWYDQRNLPTAAELVDAGSRYLVENRQVTSLKVDADVGEYVYRRDFDLGDRVTVALSGESWSEPVTTVTTVIEGSGPVSHQVTIGPEQNEGPVSLFGVLRRHGRQIRNLEAQ